MMRVDVTVLLVRWRTGGILIKYYVLKRHKLNAKTILKYFVILLRAQIMCLGRDYFSQPPAAAIRRAIIEPVEGYFMAANTGANSKSPSVENIAPRRAQKVQRCSCDWDWAFAVPQTTLKKPNPLLPTILGKLNRAFSGGSA
jgi:hypothetical protein